MANPTLTQARFARMAGGILLLCLPALLCHGVVERAAALAPLVDGTGRYWIPEYGLLAYGLVPLAFVSASMLFLAPGLLLLLSWGKAERAGTWLLRGFALSLVLVSLLGAAVTWLSGAPVRGVGFGSWCLGLGLACAAAGLWRIRRHPVPGPLLDGAGRLTLALSGLVPVGLLVGFAPKFLWESFNGDGAHAFESSRLLLRHALPFWPASAGGVALFPGVNTMLFAFPNGWYLRLFGEVEAAVRLPFLLYLAVLVGAILAVAETGRPPARRGRVLLVWTSVLAFGFALMFSATYDPYTADVALPAAQDALVMACFLGWMQSLLRREWGWLALFTALTYTASPSGLLLLGFALLAVLLIIRPRPWPVAGRAAGLLSLCLAAGALAPRVLAALGAAPPGEEHGPLGILRYFAYVQFTDWRRLLMVTVACGIVPMLGLACWRRQDAGARLLTLVTLGYFLFFFFLAHISLHHFVPVMVLPVAVAARLWCDGGQAARRWLIGWQAAALAAVLLSLPRSYLLADQRRRVSATISETVGDYSGSDPAVLHASTLLHAVLPYDWEPSVPDTSYGGSPLAWNRYAHHGEMTDSTNYLLSGRGTPTPPGMRLLASDSSAVLYIRDEGVLRSQRALRPPTPPSSPVYTIQRGILFHRSFPLAQGPRIIDVAATLQRMGIDVLPLLARLGVRRGP